jgi:hypothetical protein
MVVVDREGAMVKAGRDDGRRRSLRVLASEVIVYFFENHRPLKETQFSYQFQKMFIPGGNTGEGGRERSRGGGCATAAAAATARARAQRLGGHSRARRAARAARSRRVS